MIRPINHLELAQKLHLNGAPGVIAFVGFAFKGRMVFQQIEELRERVFLGPTKGAVGFDSFRAHEEEVFHTHARGNSIAGRLLHVAPPLPMLRISVLLEACEFLPVGGVVPAQPFGDERGQFRLCFRRQHHRLLF